jgi:hypothetical protein
MRRFFFAEADAVLPRDGGTRLANSLAVAVERELARLRGKK